MISPLNVWGTSMDNDEELPREVGYKKPPADKQFKKGQSGNPKGRPKGSRNLSNILAKELNTRIPVTENGKQKQITKQEAIVKGTVNNALRGDHKATSVIWSDLKSREEQSADGYSLVRDMPLDPADDLVMESIVARIRATAPAPADSGSPDPPKNDITVAPETGGEQE